PARCVEVHPLKKPVRVVGRAFDNRNRSAGRVQDSGDRSMNTHLPRARSKVQTQSARPKRDLKPGASRFQVAANVVEEAGLRPAMTTALSGGRLRRAGKIDEGMATNPAQCGAGRPMPVTTISPTSTRTVQHPREKIGAMKMAGRQMNWHRARNKMRSLA